MIAFDPGGTTGWALLQVHRAALESSDFSVLDNILFRAQGQFTGGENSQAREMYALIEAWDGPETVVVIEDFILRTALKNRDVLSPVRITAKIDLLLEPSGRRMYFQQPAMAKKTATDERLKDWGLYVAEGGLEHARDAMRHAITFIRRTKEQPRLRSIAWPSVWPTVQKP